jgi:hypothetical protein
MNAELVLTGGLCSVFVAWIALTILNNLDALGIACGAPLLRKVPLGRFIHLIPSWSFFAPKPATADYYLVYRDRFDGGGESAWSHIDFEARYRTKCRALWNPASRPAKACTDAVAHLARLREIYPGRDHALVLSVPYILLIARVCGEPVPTAALKRQFALFRREGNSPPSLAFVSHWHDIEGSRL